MRIRELHIDRFGGLADLHLALDGGLNLLFGTNEAGKSTVFSFIRALLYGLNGKAHKIAENERKRRLPWGQDRMGGWMTFEAGSRIYRIERTFGSVRRLDSSTLRDEITGETIALPAGREVGEYLFGVSEAEFRNTVAIAQLATASVEPDDQTLAKLANLATTGDERVSFSEVDDRLRKAMVTCQAERGNGGLLNDLTARRHLLAEERQSALDLELERSRLIDAHQRAVRESAALEAKLSDGRRLLGSGRDYLAVARAGRLADRLAGLQAMAREAEELRRDLTLDGREIDRAALNRLQECRAEIKAEEARLSELRQKQDQRHNTLAGLERELAGLESVAQVDRAAAQTAVDEAGQVDRDLLSLSQRQMLVGELQRRQDPVLARSTEARRQCEQAEIAYRRFQEKAEAERQQANREAEESRQAWQAYVARHGEGVLQTGEDRLSDPDRAAGTDRQPKPAAGRSLPLLLTGIALILIALAGGFVRYPILLALALPGLALVFIALRRGVNHLPAGDSKPDGPARPADGLRTDAVDGRLADAARVLKQAWEQDERRLSGLRARMDAEEQALAERLSECDCVWTEATAAERQAAQDWADALSQLQRDPIWQQPRFASRIDTLLQVFSESFKWPFLSEEDSAGLDALACQRLTQQAAVSLKWLQADLERRQAEITQLIAMWLETTACASVEELLGRLDRRQALEASSSRLADEAEREDGLISHAAAAVQRRSEGFRLDLLALAGPLGPDVATTEVTPDSLLEKVQQRHTRLEHLDAVIFAERQSLGLADSRSPDARALQPDAVDAARMRLRQSFPDEPDAMAIKLAAALADFMTANMAAGMIANASPESGPEGQMPEGDLEAAEAVIAACVHPLPDVLERLQDGLQDHEGDAMRIQAELQHRFSQVRSLEDIDDELADVERRQAHVRSEYDALKLARKTVDLAFRELQQSFGPQLNRRGGDILGQLTGNRYADMRVDRSLQVSVPDPATGQLREFGYLSGGTVDQAYLALRLAVAELIGSRTCRLPLFLDDVLMQYDDQRAEAALAFFARYAEEQDLQILLFTCHGRSLDRVSGRIARL